MMAAVTPVMMRAFWVAIRFLTVRGDAGAGLRTRRQLFSPTR
jgi:hypothetical protein